MNQTKRIIINTIAQYARTFIGIILALYSTRIVLFELGSSDYGLFSLVGSVLSFLSFFNTALSRSTQRYLSYYMGKSDLSYQSVVLFNSLALNIVISLVTAIIMFLLEPLLFSSLLNIETSQIPLAKSLYRIMIVSVFCTMNMSTFNAVFVSHENIVFSSIIYVLGAVLKLVAALVLSLFRTKLLAYGYLICSISLAELLIYIVFSLYYYQEVRNILNNTYIDKALLKSLFSFSGWNLYGTLTVAGINQGYAVVVNRFISLSANAGLGVASQVSGQVNNLVFSVSTAMSPVITRKEGAGDREQMIKFTMSASRISAIFYSLIAIPIIFELDYLLNIWLTEPPIFSSAFVASFLLAGMMDSFSEGFRTGVLAIGNIKVFTLVFYTVKLLSIPASVLLLLLGINPSFTLVPYILFQMIGSFISIYFFSKYTNTRPSYYIMSVFFRSAVIVIVSCFGCALIILMIHSQVLQFMAVFLFSICTTSFLSYKFVLMENERVIVQSLINQLVGRLNRQ